MCVKMYGGGEAACVDISYGDQLDCGGVQGWETRSRDTARSSSLRSMKSSWTTRSHTLDIHYRNEMLIPIIAGKAEKRTDPL